MAFNIVGAAGIGPLAGDHQSSTGLSSLTTRSRNVSDRAHG
jgi:hypothetical protein